MISLCIKLVSRAGVQIKESDVAHVELKSTSSSEHGYSRSIFARFQQVVVRMKIWENKKLAEQSKVFMEEWLTEGRAKLMKKCKKLLTEKLIENVKTLDGDIMVEYTDKDDQHCRYYHLAINR